MTLSNDSYSTCKYCHIGLNVSNRCYNDGYLSNNDGGTSNHDGGTSNRDGFPSGNDGDSSNEDGCNRYDDGYDSNRASPKAMTATTADMGATPSDNSSVYRYHDGDHPMTATLLTTQQCQPRQPESQCRREPTQAAMTASEVTLTATTAAAPT
jgi:hypothetical protein